MLKPSPKAGRGAGRPRGARTKLAFTVKEVQRTIRSVRNAGLEIGRVEIVARTGAISIVPAPAPAAAKVAVD